MAYLTVQQSNRATIESNEVWTDVDGIRDVEFRSELGQPRVLMFTVANFNNTNSYSYEDYTRIRAFARRRDVPIFLGRVVQLLPSRKRGSVRVVCVDYLHDLSSRTTSGTSYSGSRRSDIVKGIITGDGAARRGISGAGTWQQSVRHDIHIEDSSYVQSIERSYGNDDGLEDVEIGAGYETMLASIKKLSEEEPWQDIQILRYDVTRDGEASTSEFDLYTFAGLFGGALIDPPTGSQPIYIGSSKPFRYLHFVPTNSLDSDGEERPYSLSFEYHTGVQWQSLTNVSGQSLANPGNELTGTDLSIHPTLLDLGFDWTDRASGIFPVNFPRNTRVNNFGRGRLSPQDISNPLFEDKYWIRITSNLTSTDLEGRGIASITLSNLDENNESKWDYRVEDSVFFDRVAYNTEDRSEESWDSTIMEATATGDNYLYFGSAYPFVGIDYTLNADSINVATTIEYSIGATTWSNFNLRSTFGVGSREGMLIWDMPTDWVISNHPIGVTDNFLYWARIRVNANTSNMISARTASIASFKYFERGTEPWSYDYSDSSDQPPNEKPLGTKAEERWGNIPDSVLAPLEVQWRGNSTDSTIPILDYDIGQSDIDIVTRIIVHGRNGVSGYAVDTSREDTLGIIKEKIFNLYELDSPSACTQYAELLLNQYKPTVDDNGFRHGTIELPSYPIYKRTGRRPIAVREGDIIQVSITDGYFREDGMVNSIPTDLRLISSPFLVLGIQFKEESSKFVLHVSRDLLPTPNDTGNVDNILKSIAHREQAATWRHDVPTEETARSLILHDGDRLGQNDPKFRERVKDNRVIHETFIGHDKNPSLEENWEGNIIEDRNTLVIKGRDYSAEENRDAVNEALNAEDFGDTDDSSSAAITYDSSRGVLQARVKQGDPGTPADGDASLRDVAVGEWGQVDVDSSGTTEVTFERPYSTPPAVISTVDVSESSAASDALPIISAYVSRYLGTAPSVTGVAIQVDARSASGTDEHTHRISANSLATSEHSGDITINSDTATVTTPTRTQLNIRTSESSIVLDSESSSITYNVTLSHSLRSGEEVIVTLGGYDQTVITVSPTELTFSDTVTSNRVTVTAQSDDDIINDLTAIRHELAAHDDYSASDVSLSVFVTDDTEVPMASGSITLSTTSVSVAESGTASYDVSLTVPPNGSDVVRVFIDNGDISSVRLSRSLLEFNAGNHRIGQSITVTGLGDDDTDNEVVTLRHTVISENYDAAEVDLTVNVTDAGETTPTVTAVSGSIVVSRSGTVNINEGDNFSYNVSLSAPPNTGDTITVDILSSDSNVASLSTSSLRFTDSTYNRTQSVTVTGETDTNAVPNTVTITHRINSANADDYTASTETFNVSVAEGTSTTVTGSIVFDRGSLSVTENSSGVFNVKLGRAPNSGESVTINLDVTGQGSDSSLSSSSSVSPPTGYEDFGVYLRFTSDNWDTFQQVTFTSTSDVSSSGLNVSVFSSIVEGNYQIPSPAPEIVVTIQDSSAPPVTTTPVSGSIVVSRSGTVSVNEGGTFMYNVVLGRAPRTGTTVNVDITVGDTSVATVSTNRLSFNSQNMSQNVTVTGQNVSMDSNTTITHSITDVNYTAPDVSFEVAVQDAASETAAIIVSRSGIVNVNEGGTFSYNVRITRSPQPMNPVIVDITVGDTDVATVSPSRLTFTSVNATIDQEVVVTGGSVSMSRTTEITHTLRTNTNFNAPQVFFSVNVQDVATPVTSGSIIVSRTGTVGVNEGGTFSYDVKLGRAPRVGTTVDVDIAVGDTNIARVDKTRLTFDSSNHNDNQTVTVTAQEVTTNSTTTITHSITDVSYTASPVSFSVLVRDLATPAIEGSIVVSRSGTVSVNEGGTFMYNVRLSVAPRTGTTVNVVIAVDDTSIARVNKTTLTFTSTNGTTNQEVTVTGQDVTSSGTTMITHSINDMDYTASSVSFEVAVQDSTPQAGNSSIIVSRSGTAVVDEGNTFMYNVRLSHSPSPRNEIIIGIAVGNESIATVDKTALTFTSLNSHINQTVTVTAQEVTTNSTTTITHTMSPNVDLTAPNVSFNVLVRDTTPVSQSGSITFSRTNITVNESTTRETYTVSLNPAPTGPVTIRATRSGTGTQPLNFGERGLGSTFDISFPANSSDAQTVALRTSGVSSNRAFQIVHTVQSGDYVLTGNTTVNVTVVDTSLPPITGLIVLEETDGSSNVDSISLDEESTFQYRVFLNNDPRPGDTVRVHISANSGTDDYIESISGSTFRDDGFGFPSGSLSFTSANYDTPQTVTIRAAEVQGDESDILVHSVSTSPNYSAPDENVTVSISDTMDGRIVFGGNTYDVDMNEFIQLNEGRTTSYTVRLSHPAPGGGNVLVNLNVRGTNTPLRISTSSTSQTATSLQLTFTSSTYNRGQTIYVRSLENSVTRTTSYSIRHTIDSTSVYDTDRRDVGISVLNQVTGGIRLLSVGGTSDDLTLQSIADSSSFETDLDEGHIKRYSVVLDNVPNENDTVEVTTTVVHLFTSETFAQIRLRTSSNPYADSETGFGSSVTTSYTRSNWGSAQLYSSQIEVRAIPHISTSSPSVALVSQITSGNYSETMVTLFVDINNTHANGDIIVRTSSGTEIARSGGSGSISVHEDESVTVNVRLSTAPNSGEYVTLTPEYTNPSNFTLFGSGASSVSGINLRNQMGNVTWARGVNVPIGGVSSGTGSIRLYVLRYSAQDNVHYVAGDVTLNVTINAPRVVTGAIEVHARSLSVEEGSTGLYSYTLSEAPITPVSVEVRSNNSDVRIGAEHDSPLFNRRTINSDNSPVFVVLYGRQDSDALTDSGTITHSIHSGNYSASNASVPVYVADDEATQVSGGVEYRHSGSVLSDNQIVDISLSGTATIGIRLTTAPNTAVTLYAQFNNRYLSIDDRGAWLVFTPSNWNTYQNVVVTDITGRAGTANFGYVPVARSGSTTVDHSIYSISSLTDIRIRAS